MTQEANITEAVGAEALPSYRDVLQVPDTTTFRKMSFPFVFNFQSTAAPSNNKDACTYCQKQGTNRNTQCET